MRYVIKLILGFFIILLPVLSAAQASSVVKGEYIVKYKKNSTFNRGLRTLNNYKLGIMVKKQILSANSAHVKVNSEAALDSLYSDPDVEYIEPNYVLSIEPLKVGSFGSPPDPSDTYMQSSAPTQVRDSWDIQKPYNQGSKTVVAIIDSGLDTNHLLFKDSGALWENTAEKNGQTGVDDDGNGYIDDVGGWNFVDGSGTIYDDNDHGTHVAGIVLGIGQDVFVDPVRESKIKIMPLKFLDGAGSGSTAEAINAIYYAVDNGAKVINNSWGGPNYSTALHDAYAYAHDHGVVIATAAGNSNSNVDVNPIYPCGIDSPNNICVGASSNIDNKATFSNFGPLTVSVMAPGVSILSSVPGNACIAPGCFQQMSGTSMASPFVAGLAALVLREAPQLSGYQVRNVIYSSVDTKVGLQSLVSTSGRVNVYSAIAAAKLLVNEPTSNPTYNPDYKNSRSIASTEGNSNSGGGGCGMIAPTGGSGNGGGFGSGLPIILLALLPLTIALRLRKFQQFQ